MGKMKCMLTTTNSHAKVPVDWTGAAKSYICNCADLTWYSCWHTKMLGVKILYNVTSYRPLNTSFIRNESFIKSHHTKFTLRFYNIKYHKNTKSFFPNILHSMPKLFEKEHGLELALCSVATCCYADCWECNIKHFMVYFKALQSTLSNLYIQMSNLKFASPCMLMPT